MDNTNNNGFDITMAETGNVRNFLLHWKNKVDEDAKTAREKGLLSVDLVDIESLDKTVDTFGEVFSGLTGIFEPLGLELTFVFNNGGYPNLQLSDIIDISIVEVDDKNRAEVLSRKEDLFGFYSALSDFRRGFGRKRAEDYVVFQSVAQHLTSVMGFHLMTFSVGPLTSVALHKTMENGKAAVLTMEVMNTK